MKKTLFSLVTMATLASLNAQDLKVYLLSPKGIIGTGMPNDKIMIDFNADGLEDETTTADVNGNFKYTFKPENIVKSGVKKLTEGSEIWIWGLREVEAPKITAGVKDAPPPKKILITSAQKATVGTKKADTPVLKNQTIYTNATILTTNFNIPVARFDFTKKENRTDAIGNINLFTSVGAGIGVNWGEKKTVYDNNAEIVSEEFKNYFGINTGFLFSAQTGEDKKNIFAPTINLTALDFQIGSGYELGSLQAGQSHFFLTFSYSIPLYKLIRTGFLTLREKNKKPVAYKEEKKQEADSLAQKQIEDAKKQVKAASDSIKAASERITELTASNDELKKQLEIIKTQKNEAERNRQIKELEDNISKKDKLIKEELQKIDDSHKTLSSEELQNLLKTPAVTPPSTITTPVNPKTTSSFSKD